MTGAGLLLAGRLPLAQAQQERARVVLCRDTALRNLQGAAESARLRQLVHSAVASLTQKGSARAAWQSLFSEADTVAVKVNCMTAELAPHVAVIDAIAEGLAWAGVPPERIIVYDKEDPDLAAAGFPIRGAGGEYLCYGSVGAHGPGYEDRFQTEGQTTFRLSKIVTRQATAIINVPVVRHHCFAGITGALKNHFGSIHNPEDFHYFNCDPSVAEVNQAVAIRSKQRLVVCDSRLLQYEQGPAFHPEYIVRYDAVFAAFDPLALDTKLCQLIDMARSKHDLPPLAEVEFPPKHLQTAAARGLGVSDDSLIDLVVHNA
jgi:uncharacterized protein (DUF362 family)